MKKLICLTIAAIMLLSLIPLQAVAANGVTEQDNASVCYIDGATKTYYDTVIDAVKAVPAGGTATIVMVKDTVEAGWIQPKGQNITIEGKGFTISRGNAGYIFDINKSSDSADWSFTLKDAKVVGTHGFWFDINEINIINCQFDISTELGISAAPASDAVVNIVDTVWNQKTICFTKTGNGKSANITYNIENSIISVEPAFGTSGPTHQNNAVFNAHQATALNVNVDATSKIIAIGPRCGGIFGLQSTCSGLNINLEEGAELEIRDCAAGATFVYPQISADKINIVDNGAKWIVSAESAKGGVVFPKVNGLDTWFVGGSIVSAGDVYKNENATDAVVAEPFDASSAISMINGAGYKEGGMAFGMTVSDKIVSIVGEDAKFGFMIAPEEYTQFGFNDEMLSLSQRIIITTDAAGLTDGENGTKKCVLGFDGIPTDNYDSRHVRISAIGIIQYEVNGTKTTIYTPNTYTISYAELAAAAAAK